MSNIFSSPLVLESVFRDVFRDVFDEGYAVAGLDPALVFDFDDEYYRTGGSTSTFSSAITHSRTSNATMVDSDGLLKWAPHNLLTYSQDLTSAAWALISNVTATGGESDSDGGSSANLLTPTGSNWYIGQSIPSTAATITVAAWVKAASGSSAGFRLFCNGGTTNSSNLTATDSFQLFTFEAASTASGQCGVRDASPSVQEAVIVYGLHAYRSDLGGMVNNPDRGDSYVPTTSSARYLARRGHHIYNGSAWVNEGMLHESEARTNLLAYSQDFTDAAWSKTNTATLAVDATGPDGQTSAVTLVDSGATGTGNVYVSNNVTVNTSTAYTLSCFAKADQLSWLVFTPVLFTTPANVSTYFNLSSGAIGSVGAGHSAQIENCGNGWYRCSVTFTTDVSDTTGQVRVGPADGDGDAIVDLDGTSSILIYGAQFEAGPTPSSYIPTSGATVTRAADTLTVPSANLPWPTPNVIGGELVEDGWTLTGSGITQSGQTFTITSAPVNTTIDSGAVTTAGKVYQYEFTVSGQTGSEVVRFQDSGFSTVIPAAGAAGDGTYTGVYVAQGNFLRIRIYNETADNVTATLSVREIDPLAVSIQMQGRMTYADTGVGTEAEFISWELDSNNLIDLYMRTDGAATGGLVFRQKAAGVSDVSETSTTYFTPGINVPFNIASRHGSTFVNGAVDGTALTADTTPVALPDLASTDLNLGYDYMGTIKLLRIWSADLGDAGIAEAST